MAYCYAPGGVLTTYPYSYRQHQLANPNVSFPRGVDDNKLAEFDIFPVAETPKPAYDINFDIVEDTPVLINGTWTQVWTQVPASAEDIAKRQYVETFKTQKATLAADSFIQNFISMSPAQVEAYVDSNAVDLASTKALLKKISLTLLLLARREFS